MSPLRIVTVMLEPPLPFGNAVSRWYYVLLKGLVERGHRVVAFAACKNREEADAAERLFPGPEYSLRCYEYARHGYLESKFATLLKPHAYLFSPDLRRDLATELSRPFDILHLEALWSGWVGLAHRGKALLNVHYLFQIDMADHQPDSLLERARWMRTIQAENYLLRQYPLICTVSSRLSQHVQELNSPAELHTVPFGMDLDRYPFESSSPATGQPVVSLIGSFHWAPTYSAGARLLERLWPAIQKRVPEATLQLVGRRARAAFGQYENQPGIRIHEDVPDTLPYFRQATVLLYAPGRGSGVKVKVLEAFALGTPVVTTAEGVEGIPAVDGVHAGICEDDAGLVDRTVALLQNQKARQQQRTAARLLFERHCAPDVALDAFESVYSRIVGQGLKLPLATAGSSPASLVGAMGARSTPAE